MNLQGISAPFWNQFPKIKRVSVQSPFLSLNLNHCCPHGGGIPKEFDGGLESMEYCPARQVYQFCKGATMCVDSVDGPSQCLPPTVQYAQWHS